MRNLIVFLISTTFCITNVSAINHYGWYDTLNVFALSGLRLKDMPQGTVMAIIPYGEKIITQEYQPSDRRDTIDNIPGHWAKVSWGKTTGFVFDGFLSRLPVPDTNVTTLADYCKRYFEQNPLRFNAWNVELEQISSTEGAEAFGNSETMTIRCKQLAPEEMYLLMCALKRSVITEYLKKKPEDQDHLLFVRNAMSAHYEFPVELVQIMEYGVCFHGAYISIGEAD